MSLEAGCPRCPIPVARSTPAGGWCCPEHGPVPPLWRPAEAGYECFVEHLGRSANLPTYLPWPLGPGWQVTDVASVGEPGRAVATVTGCSGSTALDGPVDVLVVAEDPGTGLGARVAGTRHVDAGGEVGLGPPAVVVRLGSQTVRMWPVSVHDGAGEWDRSVVVGEAHGRWLWLVLRPASAILLLAGDWIMRDVSELGPQLVELSFGGPRPPW
ncbi:DUF6758 family protein [Nocardioides pantholopis]|uniref:DUF6758 family protein n=1 Tax=Nocardioides pantholopis TaxID=2483798 RepID=UPI0013DE1441|nr:DUF6758 family protein [Nocardioides pantholopis]